MYSLSPSRERQLLWLLALTQFTIIMDFMVMMPLGPQVMRAFTIQPAQFATAVSAYSWCSGISGLLAATYIDRFDRRRLMLVIYALFALSNLCCALAPTFAMLLFARAFAGLTGGVLGSVILTIVGDVIPVTRRGAATGTLMTALSLAAIGGVPAGVLLGAHWGWEAPFVLLVILSMLIWSAVMRVVPPINEHLSNTPPPLSQVLPDLWHLLTKPRHLNAFAMIFVVMAAHMMIVPFIAPVLVANHGVAPAQLSWLYMAGGAATFFTSRLIGRLSDRYGKRRMFVIMALLYTLPGMFITHLPNLPYLAYLAFFPFFMIGASGRMIPMQALMTTVPEPEHRGAFLSANSALQAVGMGCGAWAGGLLLSTGPNGHLIGYGLNGWIATGMMIAAALWVRRIKPAETRTASSLGAAAAAEAMPHA